ncbi:MAG TPA: ABC transporter permease [Pyrinomonadaceae bacterium]|nr:ABC transporter permease [Pyrinomonadaceae bacterium]
MTQDAGPTQDAQQAQAHSLPEEPLVVIAPKHLSLARDLRDIWAHRELLYFLMWRDVKVRYKQTALGVVWVVLQPLLMMTMFTIFFGRLVGEPGGGVPYPLFAYAGLLPWTFFSSAAMQGGNSIVNNSSLITKVYFPRLIMPLAAVGAVLLDLAISFCVLAALMVYWRVPAGTSALALPALVVMVAALAYGAGTLMAALNVKYRDVRIALPFALQVWFFATPIIYPTSSLPESWRWALSLNPMTGVVEGFRAALYGRTRFDWPALAFSAAVTLVLLACAVFTFRRMERDFADVV